jgi:nucleotide-binding universal stress UspA family protein
MNEDTDMKQLVAATNLKQDSDKVLSSAYFMASELGLGLKLVHCLEYTEELLQALKEFPIKEQEDQVWKKNYDSNVLKLVHQQLERCQIPAQDVDFDVLENQESALIDNYLAKQNDVMAMAMGATHHGEIYRFFHGSFIEKTLFNAHCDSYVIKEKMDTAPKVMALVVNDSDAYQVAKERALFFHQKFQSQVVLVSNAAVTLFEGDKKNFFEYMKTGTGLAEVLKETEDKAQKQLDTLAQELSSQGVDCVEKVLLNLRENPVKSLEDLVKKHAVKFAVLEVKHHFMNHFAVGSVAYDMLKHVPCNFYVVSR